MLQLHFLFIYSILARSVFETLDTSHYLVQILSEYGLLNKMLLLILCDAVRFFCDALRFFCDATRFFCDALRHQL